MSKPKALVIPSPRLYHQLFAPESDARLRSRVTADMLPTMA